MNAPRLPSTSFSLSASSSSVAALVVAVVAVVVVVVVVVAAAVVVAFDLRLILGRGGLCVSPAERAAPWPAAKGMSRLDGSTPFLLRQALQLHLFSQNGHFHDLNLIQSLILIMYLFHRQEPQYFFVHDFMTTGTSVEVVVVVVVVGVVLFVGLSVAFFFLLRSWCRNVQNAILSSVFDNLH